MHPRPQPAPSAAPATWLRDRIGVTDQQWVSDTVGTGFASYARVFHPLDDEPGAQRWRDVAIANGRVMHPSVQWEHISCPPGSPIPAGPTGRGYPGAPGWGGLAPVYLGPLCDLLALHTTSPNRCWFAVWEGWGWWNGSGTIVQAARIGTTPPPIEYAPDSWQLDHRAPRFDMPFGRTYLLYQGTVHDALQVGHWVTATWFEPQSPSLFWPDDHAWCVATEIDFDSTLVGGPPALVDAVVNSPDLEALAIAADAPFRDHINT